jgi:hypothetical protein
MTKGRAMSFRVQPRRTPLRLTCLALLSATAFIAVAVCRAQARDFEMGGDSNYSIMTPEPGTGSHHGAGNRHGRTSRHESQSLTATQKALRDSEKALQDSAAIASPANDTPEQIETFKRNRRTYVGSSGLVLPTPLPGPTHYAPVGTGPVITANPLPREQPPTILPGSGRAIPNLPHGPESGFQERASRCAFQSSINSIPGSQASSYMHNCAM